MGLLQAIRSDRCGCGRFSILWSSLRPRHSRALACLSWTRTNIGTRKAVKPSLQITPAGGTLWFRATFLCNRYGPSRLWNRTVHRTIVGCLYMEGKGPIPHVSVIVPTLNEADNIDSLLRPLLQAFRDRELDVEVLFADGGSTDGTVERVQAWAPLAQVHLVHAASGRGLTGDVLVAACQAKADVVVVMDADLSHSPEAAPILAQPVLDGSRDMVIGSRYIPGGRTPNWPWTRRVVSRTAAAMVWPLTDVHDPTSGFFAVRRDRLLDIS
ncbi:MAG: glycosyltransferase, partial [Planctomycetaceae bacterium]